MKIHDLRQFIKKTMAETRLCTNVKIIIHQSQSEEVQDINNKITDKKSSQIIIANHYYF